MIKLKGFRSISLMNSLYKVVLGFGEINDMGLIPLESLSLPILICSIKGGLKGKYLVW